MTRKNINYYIENVRDLSADTFTSPHQLTIDLIEDTIDVLTDYDGEVTFDDFLGMLAYRVDNVIEVINPEFVTDIDALNRLKNILES